MPNKRKRGSEPTDPQNQNTQGGSNEANMHQVMLDSEPENEEREGQGQGPPMAAVVVGEHHTVSQLIVADATKTGMSNSLLASHPPTTNSPIRATTTRPSVGVPIQSGIQSHTAVPISLHREDIIHPLNIDVLIGLKHGEEHKTVLLQIPWPGAGESANLKQQEMHWPTYRETLGNLLDTRTRLVFQRPLIERVEYSVPGIDFIGRERIVDQIFNCVVAYQVPKFVTLRLFGHVYISCQFVRPRDGTPF